MSKLKGSDQPVHLTWHVLQAAWVDHVYSPLRTVRDELFATLRERPSIVSSAQFEAEKQSLARMLQVGGCWLWG
jgi:hypothetical protein